jgi:hypothetical protein
MPRVRPRPAGCLWLLCVNFTVTPPTTVLALTASLIGVPFSAGGLVSSASGGGEAAASIGGGGASIGTSAIAGASGTATAASTATTTGSTGFCGVLPHAIRTNNARRIGRNLAFPHREVGLNKDPFQTVHADFPHTAYGRSFLDVMRHHAASGYATVPCR